MQQDREACLSNNPDVVAHASQPHSGIDKENTVAVGYVGKHHAHMRISPELSGKHSLLDPCMHWILETILNFGLLPQATFGLQMAVYFTTVIQAVNSLRI